VNPRRQSRNIRESRASKLAPDLEYRPGMSKMLLHLEYAIRIKGGDVIESSEERGPLVFVPGRRRLLPALEHIIATMEVGETRRGQLAARDAFGNEDVLPEKQIAASEFPADAKPVVGQVYVARTAEDGRPLRFKVCAIEGRGEAAMVNVRFLHPLSEHDLEYHFRLLEAQSLDPPPPPARAFGLDSAAIQLWDSQQIVLH
jgi:FKBP-type peptidyl-prolyl cis-trans isomerase 2